MSTHQKVAWLEGVFLQPLHMQQHERYIDYLFSHSHGRFAPFHWGISKLSINADFLKLGKIALNECKGILPDGTVFDIPNQDDAPLPIDVAEDISNSLVYLAVPLVQPGIPDTSHADQSSHRYKISTVDVRDSTEGADLDMPLHISRLRLQLLLEKDYKEGYSGIAIARIQEAHAGQEAALDEHFIPTCLDVQAIPTLRNFIEEVNSLLHYRGDKLVERLNSGSGGVAEISDFMLLQMINRTEPLFEHLLRRPVHPEFLYSALLQLAGELTTFTDAERRPMAGFKYQHGNLLESFDPLRQKLRQSLSTVLEENAISIPLEERANSTWVGIIADKGLLQTAQFILAVHANISPDTLRQLCLAQIKVAPVEEIRTLVNRALPGIPLQPLTVPPRQISYHSDYVYFSLNRQDPLWQQASQSTGLAFHIGGLFPGLKLEFWAIKG